MTHTQGEHAQTALAHELFAAAQLAPGEGIEDAVSRIAAALTAAPAQPAAPQGVAEVNWWEADGDKYDASISPMQPAQGVAYAELPKDVIRAVFIENGFTVKEGQTDLKQYVYDAAIELLRRARLRASNGQAPATQQAGWKLVPLEPTVDQEWEGKEASRRVDSMAEACKIYKAMLAAAPQPSPTAQAADSVPAPDIDALCARIKAADDAAADRDYMLDSDDCIKVLRGEWKAPLAMDKPERAARAPAESVTAPAGGVDDAVDAIALARYKVVPAHESMFHRFAVVAGDGKQQLYLGREVECENMARKFAGAFLDGAFYQANIAPTPPAHAVDSVLEDAALLDWIQHNGATVEVIPGHPNYDWCFRVAGLHATTRNNIREAIDAARKQGAKHDNH